jgi:hypothetical protein
MAPNVDVYRNPNSCNFAGAELSDEYRSGSHLPRTKPEGTALLGAELTGITWLNLVESKDRA